MSRENGTIPPSFSDLQRLAFALTKDAEVKSPLEPSTDLNRFVIGELPGSVIDFASALTLMARASRLQSRVATGYLPGEYNAYSGASKIN